MKGAVLPHFEEQILSHTEQRERTLFSVDYEHYRELREDGDVR